MAVARGLTSERLAEQRDELDRVNEAFTAEAAAGTAAPFRLLQGLEVDINEDWQPRHGRRHPGPVDLVIASPHVKLKMERKAMTRRLVLAAVNPHVDGAGALHRPEGGALRQPCRGGLRGPDLVFAACAQHRTAVEINARPERQDPPEELLALALEWDCLLSIDTDAHAPGQLEWMNYGCDKAALAGAEAEQIINTPGMPSGWSPGAPRSSVVDLCRSAPRS